MPTLTESEVLARSKWEFENNPSRVSVSDPEMGGEMVTVEVILLIAPNEYASFMNNNRLRRLAIEQGAFKSFEEKK